MILASFVPVALGAMPPRPRPALVQPPDPERLPPRVLTRLQEASPDDSLIVWVFFTDKGLLDEQAYRMAVSAYERTLVPQARQRRVARGGAEVVDFYDLPVSDVYVRQVAAMGARLRGTSRWLNGVSVAATPAVIRRLATLPFVRSIAPVAVYRRPLVEPLADDAQPKRLTTAEAFRLSYGASLTQLAQMHVPDLHDLGLSGRGVLIAMLDTGFLLDHVAFDSLRTRVIAQRDFINGDTNTANEPGQDSSGQHDHGTETLSTVGGYAPGSLIGPAYGARFLLAKTETVAFEQQVEEDWWMRAIEWADSMGVDVVSSSLGYNDWYQYADMDGHTAVTTQAANIAASRGIVVVNAMGNEGQSFWQKMIAPADADGAISIGAVDSTGTRASFSSIGPTYDGRIKPDVVAMGVGVRVADPHNPTRFVRSNGTSFSTPLVAGVAALLLEVYPTWTPEQVKDALRRTAHQASTPDTLRGWGVVNALEAYLSGGDGIRIVSFEASNQTNGVLLTWQTTREVYNRGWNLIRRNLTTNEVVRANPLLIPGAGLGIFTGLRTTTFLDSTVVAGARYEYTLQAVTAGGTIVSLPAASSITFNRVAPPQFALFQNYPNPFNASTQIEFDLLSSVHVTLTISNVLGQPVRVLVNRPMTAGHYVEAWDGTDERGRALASGLYLYRLTAGAFISTKKMILLR